MPRRWSGPLSLLIVLASVVVFAAGGDLAARKLIGSQQRTQLEEIASVALRRGEAAAEFGAATLRELAAEAPLACDPAGLQSLRLHVYRRGAVKDIRVTGADGGVICSAYPETLEFDKGWTTRDKMLPTADPELRLFRVEQFYGAALGVFRAGGRLSASRSIASKGPEGGAVAILGLTGSSFDIMPTGLQNRSAVALELTDGSIVARTTSVPQEEATDMMTVSRESQELPLRAVVSVERAALQGWSQEPYWPVVGLSAVLGAAFGGLFMRLHARPQSPVDALDAAIASGEFHPFLQPIFSLGSGEVVGAEILARQIKDGGEVIPPSRFIALAEQSGRIRPITWQILARALDDLKPLLAADPGFKLSVNIAPRQFMEERFADDLAAAVARAQTRPEQITLELTEREAFEELSGAAQRVAELRALGFRVAIDDVGIGHSGLSQIQKLGADTMKIDKFFVDGITRDASAQAIVEMLVRLAREMGMTVVAEGIEAENQAAALKACGVGLGQGYLVSPPLPAEGFLAFVEARRTRKPRRTQAGPVAAAA